MAAEFDEDGLPPLAGPEATDRERGKAVMARFVARHGALSLERYRQVYEQVGVAWPGDQEVRQRHVVAEESAS